MRLPHCDNDVPRSQPVSTIPIIPDTPRRRYGALSDMLSGVRLIERRQPAVPSTAGNCNRFCDRWSADDIAQTLVETGAVAHWKRQGFHDIIVDIAPTMGHARHAFDVWTTCENRSRELLVQVVVWLEDTYIDEFDVAIPTFCVEHLRLQTPNINPSHELLPGQDFPASGQLRRIFGILQHWAICLQARAMTEIPEFFHTAYIFSRYFTYADSGMESTFRAMCRDLLPPANSSATRSDAESLQAAVARVSRAFEDGHIALAGAPYYWPTELQIYPLDAELARLLDRPIVPSQEVFRFL